MPLAEILRSLFPAGHQVEIRQDGLIMGDGKRRSGSVVAVVGIADGTALGISGVLPLAEYVL